MSHRWDAENVVGRVEPLTDRVASIGLEEFGGFWFNQLEGLQTLALVATDLGRTLILGDGDPTHTIEGTGSEIYLRLMQRPSSVVLPDDWAEAVDAMGQPPSAKRQGAFGPGLRLVSWNGSFSSAPSGLLAVFFVVIYNGLVRDRNRVDNAWGQVESSSSVVMT